MPPKHATALLTIDQARLLVIKTLGLKKLSRPSIYSYINTKGFPKAISFGLPRKWRRDEVETWLKNIIAGE